MKNKQLLFKIGQFPVLSETFILAQIITAIKCGYDVKILVGKIFLTDSTHQQELIDEFNIADKIIIEDFNIPKNKIVRLLKWCLILFQNFQLIGFIIKFYKKQTKFSLGWLYQWYFYKQFKNVSIFHVQYGTNKYPLDLLKEIGFLKGALVVSFHGHDAFFPINGIIQNNGYYETLFRTADAIVANTLYLADVLIELNCPSSILKRIEIGVDTDFFKPAVKYSDRLKNNQIKIIMIGRLHVIKGHILAFRAINKLINKGHNVSLTLIGEGSERTNLETYIRDNQLEASIRLVGAKSQNEVRTLLRNHDMLIHPSVALPNGRSETLGLVMLEAQACGLPVVVFDSGGVKFALKESVTGFVCNEFDIDDMCNKIERLINDKHLILNMGNQAVRFVQEFYSQKSIDKKWKKLYNKLTYNE